MNVPKNRCVVWPDSRPAPIPARHGWAALSLATLVFVFGCQAFIDATEIVVEHGTDLIVGVEIKELRVRIFDPKTKLQLIERIIPVSPQLSTDGGVATAPFRLTYSLTPMQGVSELRLVVTARGPIEERQHPVPGRLHQSAAVPVDGRRRLAIVLRDDVPPHPRTSL